MATNTTAYVPAVTPTSQVRSCLNRDQIQIVITDANNWVRGSEESAHLEEARALLRRAMERLKHDFLLTADREQCWAHWKEVNRELRFKREEIWDRNYAVIRGEIRELSSLASYGNPYEALGRVKQIRHTIWEIELSRDQRRWLTESLEEWRDVASRRIDERNAEQERHRRAGIESRIDRLSDFIAKNEALVSRIQEEIDDLEEKIRNAWNEEWADSMRERVEEKYKRIAESERRNEELAEQIEAARAKL